MNTRSVATLVVGCAIVSQTACGEPDPQVEETPDWHVAIDQALPESPIVAPKQARSLLLFNLSRGFLHESIEWADYAIARMGEKSGAYTTVVSSDTMMFQEDRLAQFDAVLFNNTTGELFEDPALRASLLSFVRGGGGVVGLHAATDCFYEWPEFGEMMGGYFVNHPWTEEVTLFIEEPDHPVTAPFDSSRYVVADEIYQFRDPYSRDRLRVLISLDTARLDTEREGVLRDDRDFAVSWIHAEGAGRVFYSSLGHRYEIFTDATILRHWLAGIQYALGDLEAEDTPRM